jgi:hypothetical protein
MEGFKLSIVPTPISFRESFVMEVLNKVASYPFRSLLLALLTPVLSTLTPHTI